jgi:hypothetical protein
VAIAPHKRSTALVDSNDPIHVKDIEKLTYEDYLNSLNRPDAHKSGIPRVISSENYLQHQPASEETSSCPNYASIPSSPPHQPPLLPQYFLPR